MGAYDEVINMIKKKINEYPVSDSGEILISSQKIEGFPDLEEFTNPEPDIEWEGLLEEPRDLLGSYRPMRSPGVITLYSNNLNNFFWSMVKACYQRAGISFISKPDMVRVLHFVVTKTYQHEFFHFSSDVMRNLFNSQFETYLEEALAVAYARLQIITLRGNIKSHIGQLNGVLYETVLQEAFRYQSRGYRDWVKYPDESSFKNGLLNYLQPRNYQILRQNNVPIEDWICPDMGIMNGYLEKVV